MKFFYLSLDILSLSIPLAYSFDKRIQFAKNWKSLFLSLTPVASFFLIWDIIFTDLKIWGFNPAYLTGIAFMGLPIEEWLFFWMIPYSCLFIYEAMKYFVKIDILGGSTSAVLSLLLTVVLLVLGLTNYEKLYTSVTFFLTAVLLLLHVFWFKKKWLGKFYIGYFVSLIPFFIVNGILTGSLIEDPIVWYNDTHNMGMRMGTIPVEDSIYLLLLLLMNTTLYEYLKGYFTVR